MSGRVAYRIIDDDVRNNVDGCVCFVGILTRRKALVYAGLGKCYCQ